jgi:cobalt-zinc-cadmium efflux system membrane fusion protein
MTQRIIFALLLCSHSMLLAQAPTARQLTVSEQQQALLNIQLQELVAMAEGTVGEITLRVSFRPDGEWVIKTPMAGVLQRIFVQQGDRVSTGDALVIVRSAAMVDLQRDFLKAEAEASLQESYWSRDQKLREVGSISERRWQETQFNHAAARTEYAGLRGRLVLAGLSDSDLDELSRNMQISPDITLRAPADAVVMERPAQLGDQLDGSELLVRLGDPHKLVLEGTLAAAAAAQLAAGAELALTGGEARAEVVFVSGIIDPQSQTVAVRAEPRHAAGLMPGQLTHWKLVSSSGVLSLPSSAVVKIDGKDTVFVATATGFELREVQVRNTGSGAWIVLGGLAEGERIAVTGTAALKGMSLGMGGGDGQ